MKKENMASCGEVKSTVNSLETSPSKNASQSNPTYTKMGGKSGGGKGGFGTKKSK
jgi:hypothetical protein